MINYCAYSLIDVFPEEPLPGDLFLQVSQKYIKYKNKEDFIDTDRYKHFEYKQLQNVFVLEQDLVSYQSWTKEIRNRILANKAALAPGPEGKQAVEAVCNFEDTLMQFFGFDLSDEAAQELESKTRELINNVKENRKLEQALVKINTQSKSMLDHSLNVANLSLFLALNLGFNSQPMLETVYLGALLHDYGKTQIDKRILDRPNHPDYKAAMKQHPLLGATALMKDNKFNDDVLRIIQEHQERHDGKGFPNGVKGRNIFSLTRIVSLANDFDKRLSHKRGILKEIRREVIDELELEEGRRYDPDFIKKAVGHLRSIYG